jgi:hypothetical protein
MSFLRVAAAVLGAGPLFTAGFPENCGKVDWDAVAEARLVAVGRVLPLRSPQRLRFPRGYRGVRFRIEQKLWGKTAGRYVVVVFHPETVSTGLAAALETEGMSTKVLIMPARTWGTRDVFLITGARQYGGPAGASSCCVARIAVTLDRIAKVAVAGTREPAPIAHLEEVRAALDRLTIPAQFPQAVVDLCRIGKEGVPALVALMDDGRPVTEHLVLPNAGPYAFEANRMYGPKKVVDAVAGILNHITGKSFGEISSGDSEEERVATVRAWRAHLARTGGRVAQENVGAGPCP